MKQKRLPNMVPAEIEEIQDAADEFSEADEAHKLAAQIKRDKADALADVMRTHRAELLEDETEDGGRKLVYSRDGYFVELADRQKVTVKRTVKMHEEEPPRIEGFRATPEEPKVQTPPKRKIRPIRRKAKESSE